MEIFSASSNEQFKYIKKIIDNCDYYVLILKGRYGTINETTGLSYTEMEYNYACEKNIPILVFPYSTPENLSVNVNESRNRTKFWDFRNRVLKNRMCKLWDNSSEIGTHVINSLNEEAKNNPQIGWTRLAVWEERKLIEDINILRQKKFELGKEVRVLKDNSKAISKVTISEDLSKLKITGIRYDRIRGNEYRSNINIDLYRLFQTVGKSFEEYKKISEIMQIIVNGVNILNGSCFTYIEQADCKSIMNKFCEYNLLSQFVYQNSIYYALSIHGKEKTDSN